MVSRGGAEKVFIKDVRVDVRTNIPVRSNQVGLAERYPTCKALVNKMEGI